MLTTKLPSSLERTLRKAVAAHNLSAHYDLIRPLARLTFLLRVEPLIGKKPPVLGGSRLGGTPDLPSGWRWAVEDEGREYEPDERQLLSFIGQINFGELPALGQPLPSQGILFVFASQEKASGNIHKLLFHDGPSERLIHQDEPDDDLYADEDDSTFGTLLVREFIPSVSLPDALGGRPALPEEVLDSYSELVTKLLDDPEQREPSSRLLGYPFSPYGDLLPGADWQLLLQAQSFFAKGKCLMNFWDAGCMQIIAPTANLARADFTMSAASVYSN